LIETTIRQMMPLASQRKIILEGDIQGVSTTIAGDYDKLKQALVNLVDNGLRFTAEGGCVRVLARQVPDELRIEVKDDGPGIPLSDQPYVFERFWRGDHARSHSAGGSGLGLAIVKEIISLHGGTIRVDSPPGGTCAFTIILPI